jgi:Transglutaminase-like superfamily
MAQYFLSQHVYLCQTPDHAVFLDLDRDEYLGIESDDVEVLRRVVWGWPQPNESRASDFETRPNSSTSGPHELLTTMIANGQLTTDAANGKDASPVSIPKSTRALIDGYEDVVPKVRFSEVANFLRSYLVANSTLRMRPLRQVVRRVAARAKRRGEATHSVDLSVSHDLVVIFTRLRPLVFTTHNACLLDSFALVEFLAHYRQFPLWVMGVATQPFGAHCWVQYGDTVFNDAPYRVNRFTPILAV